MIDAAPFPHPTNALGRKVRFWAMTLAIAGAIVALVVLGALSDDLDRGGATYNEFQTAGSTISNILHTWSSDARTTAAEAVWTDIGFAVAYGLAGVLAFGLLADKVAARRRCRFRELSATYLAAAAWLILAAAVMDLIESALLLTVLADFGAGDDVADLGRITSGVGIAKWGLVALTGLALVHALILFVPIAPITAQEGAVRP